MKKLGSVMVMCGMVICLWCAGCGEKRAASSREAIETANAMEAVEQKVDYLVGQAKAFHKSEEYQEAVNITQYVLRSVDRESQEAKELLEKSKKELAAAAQGALEDAKKTLGDFGK